MSVHAFVADVQGGARRMPSKCSPEQSLVYAVEHVVEREMPTRVLTFDEARALIEEIAFDEDVDPPTVERIRSNTFDGVASNRLNVIGIKSTTNALIVCHEFAHIVAGFGHDDLWRSKFVDLVRRYISVQHASLLHTLYLRSSLPVDHWRA